MLDEFKRRWRDFVAALHAEDEKQEAQDYGITLATVARMREVISRDKVTIKQPKEAGPAVTGIKADQVIFDEPVRLIAEDRAAWEKAFPMSTFSSLNCPDSRRLLKEAISRYRRDSGKFQVGPTAMTYVKTISTPTPDDLINWFSYHAPVGDQAARYEVLRAAGKVFAEKIVALTVPGTDQDEAIKLVRSVVHWANAAIACSPVAAMPAILVEDDDERT